MKASGELYFFRRGPWTVNYLGKNVKKIHFISLGCAKNLVDSERLAASAASGACQLCSQPQEADIIVVNTCAFLQSAVEEALEALMEAGRLKKPGARLVAAGCLPARYAQGSEAQELRQGLAEVDLWLPPSDYSHFESLLWPTAPEAAPAFGPENIPLGPRLTATPFFRAFLKIAEGCDNRCRYCLIPRLRGRLKSYDPDWLEQEARRLVEAGVRELTLVAQDLTAYGRDRAEQGALVKLVRRLAKIEKLRWLRLLYAYPEGLSETVVRELAATDKVTAYLDIPFQHAHPAILKAMGRRAASPLALVEKLRRWWPGLALRTTLMVGFPGEGEEEFEALSDFVRQAAFEHLGVFKFSPEPEAPASGYAGQVPQFIKEKRRRRLLALQRRISRAHNRARLGSIAEILVEGPSEDNPLVTVGRASFQAPEVDGVIYFNGPQPQAGQLVKAEFIRAGDYDLIARLL